jgi:hypothetical protein
MFLTMWRTGMRKDDAIRLRQAAAWARPDGGFNLRPGASKTDPLGKVWGLDVISLPAPCSDPLDASSGLHTLPPARPNDALFRGADGRALSHALVDAVFRAAALAALGPEAAEDLSTQAFHPRRAPPRAAAPEDEEDEEDEIRRLEAFDAGCAPRPPLA